MDSCTINLKSHYLQLDHYRPQWTPVLTYNFAIKEKERKEKKRKEKKRKEKIQNHKTKQNKTEQKQSKTKSNKQTKTRIAIYNNRLKQKPLSL